MTMWDSSDPDVISSIIHVALGVAVVAKVAAQTSQRPSTLRAASVALLLISSIDFGRWLMKVVT